MPNLEASLKITFNAYSEILENWNKSYLPMKLNENEEKKVVYIPDENITQGLSGVKLKDDVGYIAIQQEVNKSGDIVSYVYKFISAEYEYLMCRKYSKTDDMGIFNFHFDKCENDFPHKPHITVINRSIRYISKEIKLGEFLEFIRDHFYVLKGGEFVKKAGNIWDNRF
ncbi:MAG: hypothetical protein WCT11_00475 [Candidatus Magasanikbacteria bacterium]